MDFRQRPVPDLAERPIDIRAPRVHSNPTSIIVVGAGGHGRELADIVRAIGESTGEVQLVGVCDDGQPDRIVLARSAITFLGDRSALIDREVDVHLGLGYPAVRAELDAALNLRPARPLVHPTATVGAGSDLDVGAVVAQQAAVTTNVRLGRHTHINVGASISHDCVIGDYVTICPGATVTGSVTIGDMAFVGAGATILPGVHIGSSATVGAGAVVIEDVADGQVVTGIPGRPTTC